MAMDITDLLSIAGSSLSNTISTNQTNPSSGADFSNYLLGALSDSGASSSATGNFLDTAVSSISGGLADGLLTGGSSGNSLTDYMNNGSNRTDSLFSSPIDPAGASDLLGTSSTSDFFSNALISSLQSQLNSLLVNASGKLESGTAATTTEVGSSRSEGVQQAIERVQDHISGLENFIPERKIENSLLDALDARASLTQYLINKNNSSAL